MRMIRRLVGFALALLCPAAMALKLKKGQDGLYALYLQERLQYLGYDVGEPDGRYGNATVRAVKAFQKAQGLKQTGTVDDTTWDRLFDETVTLYGKAGSGPDAPLYTVRYNLPAPFTALERRKTADQTDGEAVLTVGGEYRCTATLTTGRKMDLLEAQMINSNRDSFTDTFEKSYQGSKYRLYGEESYLHNGKDAWVCSVTWEFFNGSPLTHYTHMGLIALDEVQGTKTFLYAVMHYNVPSGTPELINTDDMKSVLSGARCDRDVLYEYKAGEKKRLKAAGIRFTIPEFQPVDDGTGLSGMILHIQKYVDSAADGTAKTVDGPTCVSLYYGAKLMEWYALLAAAGQKPEDIVREAGMSLAVAAMDPALRRDLPAVRGQLAAALSAARLALTRAGKPYLTALGIGTPKWKEADLEKLITGLDSAFAALAP